MVNGIAFNDGPVRSSAVSRADRPLAEGAAQAGFGVLSFADILMMLFSPDKLKLAAEGEAVQIPVENSEEDFAEDAANLYAPALLGSLGLINNLEFVDVPGNEGAAREALPEIGALAGNGTDAAGQINSASDAMLLGRLESEALNQLYEQRELSAEELLAEIGEAKLQRAFEMKTALAKAASAFRSAEEAPERPEAEGRSEVISVSYRGTSAAPEAGPWDELRRTVGEVKLGLGRGREEKSPYDEAVKNLRAPEGLSAKQTEAFAPAAEETEASEATARDYGIAEQIRTGLAQRLGEGKNEFTMKLRPEKLGEITVKLIEESGKMTLRIEAARSETARLINSDLTALKEAVGPMQVEVHEAVTALPEPSQQLFYQFGAGGQQFANNQQFNRGWGVHYSYAPEGEPEEVSALERQTLINLGLDRYV